MSRPHRKPTASAKKVAKIAFTGAGFQRADHAGSGGRSAGARAGCPLSAMPVKAQHIVRAGVLAVALGVGGAVANTPAVAFAEPDDTRSSEFVVWFVVVDVQFVIRIRGKCVINGSASSTTSSASAAGSSSGSTSENVQSSVDSQTSSTSSPRDASTADPRSGVVQSSGCAHTRLSPPSSSDTTASAEATSTETGAPSAVAAASPAEPTAASPTQQPTAASPTEQPAAASPAEQPAAASPTEQPAAPAPSAEPVPSLVARDGATPDAPHGDSHTALNSAGSAQRTVPDRRVRHRRTSSQRWSSGPPRPPRRPLEPRTATEAAVESVASISSAVEGAPETQAVAMAFSDPWHRRTSYPTSCQRFWHLWA